MSETDKGLDSQYSPCGGERFEADVSERQVVRVVDDLRMPDAVNAHAKETFGVATRSRERPSLHHTCLPEFHQAERDVVPNCLAPKRIVSSFVLENVVTPERSITMAGGDLAGRASSGRKAFAVP